jgi:DNA-binding beta-propeller fold protein YncE
MSRSSRQWTTFKSQSAFAVLVAGISLVASLLIALPNAGAQGSTSTVTLENSQRYFNPVAVVAHGKYLWVADNSAGVTHHGAIYRIDIATGKTIPIVSSLFDDPLWIYSDGTDLWIANQYGGAIVNGSWAGSILKLDIATNTLTKVVNKAIVGPTEMTSDGKYLWFIGRGSELLRMNIASGAITVNNSLATAGESVIASDKNYVWVGGARLLRISKATNKIKVIDPNRLTGIHALVSDGTNLWVQWGNRHLVELNIATGALKSTYNPMFEFNEGLVTTGNDVWMTDYYNRTVLEFDSATGKVTEIDSPLYSVIGGTQQELFAITSEGKHLWVTTNCSQLVNGLPKPCGTVLKITP